MRECHARALFPLCVCADVAIACAALRVCTQSVLHILAEMSSWLDAHTALPAGAPPAAPVQAGADAAVAAAPPVPAAV
jgi:hypothetical protein